MPRGPFQGTFNPNVRPTVVTAPDAIVYINGEQDVIGCPNCKRRFDFGKYITSIQTNLDVDSVPGSATISMSVPRHTIDDFYFDGVPVVSPMMEIEIYGKGYYLLEGIPQYYPMFWGLITEVNAAYSNGENTVTLQCADILKWWEICRMNVNPAFTGPTPQLGRSIFGNVLYGTNPYDMIFTLANMAFGDVILGTGSLVSLYKEAGQTKTFNAALGDIMQYWASRFSRIRSNLLLYGVNGIAVRGDSIAHAYESGKFTKGKSPVANAVRNANGGTQAAQLAFDPTDPDVTAFRTQFSQAGEVNFWQQEYQTKLEIANACKEAVGFEFYMDSTGDIVFKPPFYNLDTLSNKPISWLQDIDIIDINFSDSEAEVITQLTIQGSYGGNIEYGFGPEITPFTSVTDYHLLKKYGWRPQTYNSEFMGDLTRMFYHGLDLLDRINSKRHQASVNIPMRPELRLGFPVYIPFLDQMWYVKGISHNIQFGGRATTSLTLTARRGKFLAPKGISILKTKSSYDATAGKLDTGKLGSKKQATSPKVTPSSGKVEGPPTVRQLAQRSFDLDLGDAATLPPIKVDPENPDTLRPYEPLILRHPKTGKIVGYPNVVMVYTRPYDPAQAFDSIAGQKKPGTNKNVSPKNKDRVREMQKNAEEMQKDAHTFDQSVDLSNKYSHNRYSYGLNSAGVYVYAHDVDKSITQFALLPSKNVNVTKDGQAEAFTDAGIKLQNPNSMVRPVSDERGFEVIGHYRYGRGVSLRDGSLIYNEGSSNTIADVGTQLALGGDLFATLNAQSQGLTTVTTAYPNPADAISRLQPEDLETAAVMLPGDDGKRVPQFSNTGTNFVDSAPLGSPEADGVPTSLEASQLSRALSLSEMTVREDLVPGDPKCDCQAGRAELAFINVGYQLQPLNPAVPTEGSTLFDQQYAGTAAAPGSFGYFSQGDIQQPFASNLKATDIVTRVEQYLSNLYEALDAPHQQLENSLRGDPSGLESDLRKLPDLFTGGEGDPTFGNITPPFSSPNRAALGDPVATAQQVVSSSSDLKKTFNEFGSNLKKSQQKSQLEQQISQLRAKVSRLKARLSEVEEDLADTHSAILGNTDTPEFLTQQIAQTEQDILHKETELSQLG
jgi:hypothetical protein